MRRQLGRSAAGSPPRRRHADATANRARAARHGPRHPALQRRRRGLRARPPRIKLQLQWLPQAQFAGYFAALDQGYFEERGPRTSTSSSSGGRHRAAGRSSRQGERRLRDRVGAQGARQSREPGREPHRHRADLPAARAPSRCRSGRLRTSSRSRDFEGKTIGIVGLRQRVARCSPAHGRRGRTRRQTVKIIDAGLQHERPPAGRHRRRPGDDLQRVRPGARDGEP